MKTWNIGIAHIQILKLSERSRTRLRVPFCPLLTKLFGLLHNIKAQDAHRFNKGQKLPWPCDFLTSSNF